ncbi:hypothetical protein [Salinispora arenicola]|uniref:hypothetical protein n=1 Tax=Salinispora arenicola TaxID=168697 RepID=UPI0012BC8090|nr:hypothetical protein [Salinispora arenicola]
MNRYDLASEAVRVLRRPDEEPIGALALLAVAPATSPEAYGHRLRALIGIAIHIVRAADFDQEDVPVDALPQWFLELSNEESVGDGNDEFGRLGKLRYLQTRENRPWGSEDWIYCFEPGLRAWSWWDVTLGMDGRVNVWIDTRGEAHIPCEELWWAVYVSGASTVEPMILESAETWRGQDSLAATA